MIGLLFFVLAILVSPFKSKSRLEAENAVLRHQLIVLRRKVKGRVRLTNSDRWFFIQLYRWFPSILKVLAIIHPETLVRWHRAGFRCYWHWKSRSVGGRPLLQTDELLNETLFFDLDHARAKIAGWVSDFNLQRPHSSLGYLTPAPSRPVSPQQTISCATLTRYTDHLLLTPRHMAQNMPRL